MTLFTKCINVIAKPDAIEMHKNQLALLPVNVKNVLLTILCKRGYIKDPYILKQLINSKVIVMDLSECEVSDELLLCLYICKNLRKLDLSLRRRQNRCVTTGVLNSLFLNLHWLRILAIPHCKEVTDEVIKTICENCQDLRELHIPNSSITDLSLYMIGHCLPYLSVLNILGTQVCDKGIQYLTSGSLSESLSEINIDKCPNISPHSSTIVAEKCPNIKIFTFGSCINNEELNLAMNGIQSKAKQVFWSV